jgi:hypothetical protein
MFTLRGNATTTRFASVAAIALTCAVGAQDQGTLTGKWQGETRGGAALVLDLTVKGAELTGTLTRDDVSTPISEGKVTKNTFTFNATLGDRTDGFSGELADNQIKIWLDRQGPSTAIVLHRVKTASPD